MTNEKKAAVACIDGNAETICTVADKIWDCPELSLMEYQSAAILIQALKDAGFTVNEKLGGIDTCFSGSYGSGRPVIGILGEFDALSGLSQTANLAEKKPVTPGGAGHGCGHNLLGAGSFAAALAVKNYLETACTPGTVIFFGCPGEEGGASKAFLARDGYWKSLDAALSWHPDDVNEVSSGSTSACIQSEYIFDGVAAHAAGEPEMGRSALDAAELLNIGVQYLREHMPRTASVHYAMTDSGGVSPNVVQAHASVLYMVRDSTVKSAVALKKRVDQIAAGAALMTETKLSERFIDGLSEIIPNFTLEKALYENMTAVGAPEFTKEEHAFAAAVKATFPARPGMLPGAGAQADTGIAETVAALTINGTRALNDFIMPPHSYGYASPGSTDVGDVSFLTPTAQIRCATMCSLCPGHSWQTVAMGKSSIAHKGLLYAGKVLALTAIDLFETPALLSEARAEFEKRTVGGYTCPIPANAVPTVV